jgi:hypothetical protein
MDELSLIGRSAVISVVAGAATEKTLAAILIPFVADLEPAGGRQAPPMLA